MAEKQNTLTIVSIVGLVVVIVVLALVFGLNRNGSGGSGMNENTISVSGNYENNLMPDKAEVYVLINTEALSAKDAEDNNAEISNKVIAALKGIDVSKDDIETTDYLLSKKTRWDYVFRKEVDEGYQVRHVLKVTTKDIQNVGDIVDVAVDAGANGIDSINFGLTEDREKKMKEDALVEASSIARDKAESIAKGLGAKLGKIKSVQESNFYYMPYNYRAEDIAMAKEGGATTIAPQKVQISAMISIVYEVK